ncbi:MAG: translation initiation factor IF-2 N-terminal domain-containing protein, partial [Deltaproteobacteria bacterium]|nr:translation initiation factor IF-2 N-terminal domain-containing protein [Deltaproteobacteria bacterium]
MALLTVDDLARDLKVRNEDLLRELATLGYHVDSPESRLETDDPVALRAKLVMVLPQREVVEKRIKPTVIRRRMKKEPATVREEEAPPESPHEDAEDLAEAEAEPEPSGVKGRAPLEGHAPEKVVPPRKPKKKAKKIEPARIIEMAPRPAAREPA